MIIIITIIIIIIIIITIIDIILAGPFFKQLQSFEES